MCPHQQFFGRKRKTEMLLPKKRSLSRNEYCECVSPRTESDSINECQYCLLPPPPSPIATESRQKSRKRKSISAHLSGKREKIEQSPEHKDSTEQEQYRQSIRESVLGFEREVEVKLLTFIDDGHKPLVARLMNVVTHMDTVIDKAMYRHHKVFRGERKNKSEPSVRFRLPPGDQNRPSPSYRTTSPTFDPPPSPPAVYQSRRVRRRQDTGGTTGTTDHDQNSNDDLGGNAASTASSFRNGVDDGDIDSLPLGLPSFGLDQFDRFYHDIAQMNSDMRRLNEEMNSDMHRLNRELNGIDVLEIRGTNAPVASWFSSSPPFSPPFQPSSSSTAGMDDHKEESRDVTTEVNGINFDEKEEDDHEEWMLETGSETKLIQLSALGLLDISIDSVWISAFAQFSASSESSSSLVSSESSSSSAMQDSSVSGTVIWDSIFQPNSPYENFRHLGMSDVQSSGHGNFYQVSAPFLLLSARQRVHLFWACLTASVDPLLSAEEAPKIKIYVDITSTSQLGPVSVRGEASQATTSQPQTSQQKPTQETTGLPEAAYQSVFAQTCSELSKLDRPSCLRSKLKKYSLRVRIAGEAAEGYPGPFRYLMQAIANELESQGKPSGAPTQQGLAKDTPLFILCPNGRDVLGENRGTMMVNPSVLDQQSLQQYFYFGQLMGMAIRSGACLSLSLAPVFWQLLRYGVELLLSQHSGAVLELIGSFDAGLARYLFSESYGNLTNISEEDFEAQALTYTCVLSDGESTVELFPGGQSCIVAFQDRFKYRDLIVRCRLEESDKQMDYIRAGLNSVIPESFPAGSPICLRGQQWTVNDVELSCVFSLLTWRELETMVCGEATVNLEVLKKHTRFVAADHERIGWFWNILHSFDSSARSRFLQFVWGTTRLPSNMSGMTFHVDFSRGGGQGTLPTADTCFFTLHLPRYSSEDQMKERLVFAVDNCVSMQKDGDIVQRSSGPRTDSSDRPVIRAPRDVIAAFAGAGIPVDQIRMVPVHQGHSVFDFDD
mmetsp:Transcript_41691/g.81792  ORF Transcript_41691/g.81792 Transcript_41691/m.81792 type:complete len:1003 (+) Transcript_41691:2649-5657(+)